MSEGPFEIVVKVRTKRAKAYCKFVEDIFNRPKNVKVLEAHAFNIMFGTPCGIYVDENCNFKVVKL